MWGNLGKRTHTEKKSKHFVCKYMNYLIADERERHNKPVRYGEKRVLWLFLQMNKFENVGDIKRLSSVPFLPPLGLLSAFSR